MSQHLTHSRSILVSNKRIHVSKQYGTVVKNIAMKLYKVGFKSQIFICTKFLNPWKPHASSLLNKVKIVSLL